MTEEEKFKQITAKYGRSFGELSDRATAKEFKFVMKYIAEESNRKQREIAGLDTEKKQD